MTVAEPATCDEELLRRSAGGDPDAFRGLVERYRGPLFRFLVRCAGDAHRAEDLFQETFLSVHANLLRFRPAARFRPWVYTIAVNLARDEARRRRVRPDLGGAVSRMRGAGSAEDGPDLVATLEGAEVDPLEAMEAAERAERVRAAVDDLPEKGREAVILYYYEGLRYHEIAEVTSVPLGTVKSRIHNAMARVMETLTQSLALRPVE
ncbi:MAG: sigma-70 family RNA polymerase sigma factor [Planctomycetes bacterium]|nr:sigma-70 family RNA polymerase sigma factor [Planctomycetota bacterium]